MLCSTCLQMWQAAFWQTSRLTLGEISISLMAIGSNAHINITSHEAAAAMSYHCKAKSLLKCPRLITW